MHQRLNLTNNLNPLIYISKTSLDETFKPIYHSHPNLEIILVVKNQGTIVTSSKNIKVKKGSLIILNQKSRHYEEGKDLTFYALGINKISFFLKNDFTKKIITYELNNEEFNEMLALYQILYQESLSNDDKKEQIINHLYGILRQLILRKEQIIINDNDSSTDSDLVYNIKNIISNNYYQDIKLDDIAKSLSLSKSLICHQFKSQTNMTIIEYKIKKQLEEAHNLLMISDMTISQISSLVGFSSNAYFTKCFKNYYHLTPKQVQSQKNINE
jgi:AraC-like DNA-binding protein